jgi:hypothetical protein
VAGSLIDLDLWLTFARPHVHSDLQLRLDHRERQRSALNVDDVLLDAIDFIAEIFDATPRRA